MQEIAPLSDSVFGDRISLYSGATTFEAVDASIPGNSTLPVALARVLVVQDQRKQPSNGDGLPGFADWSLDVPYIDGTFTQQNGWSLYSATPGSTNRCSDNTDWPYTLVPIPGGSGFAPYGQIWNGNQLHIPGSGNQVLLANNQSKSYAYANGAYTGSSVWKWVTASNWKLRCIGSVSNLSGEGFIAVSPDGVSYTFNYAVTHQASALTFLYNTKVTPVGVPRVRIFLLATHVEDRFGNWVNYGYSGDHLSEITSSDGRSISLAWAGDSITSVTSALGTWAYGYATASWTNQFGTVISWPYLSSVTQPDGSTWRYTINSGARITNKNDWPNYEPINSPSTQCQAVPVPNSGAFQYTVSAPSGASATYSFAYGRHYRSMVPLGCVNDPTPTHDYPLDATNFFDNFYLTSKQVSGPGLVTENWTYDYGDSGAGSYFNATTPWIGIASAEPYEPPGSCSACAVSKVVTVAGPVSVTKSTYGVQYARNEGQLLQTQVLDLSGNVLKTTAYTYISDAQAPGQTFPDIAGYDLRPAYMDPMGNRNRPVVKTAITQDGVTFTTDVSGFDVLGRATGTSESSSLGNRSTVTAYADNPSLWVLGKPLSQSVDGTVASQTDYDSLGRPIHDYAFGRLASTRAWNVDGTLASVKDGGNHATTLSNWKRGIPQSVGFADGSGQSAGVNDAGWITSLTDENGFVTNYGYDAMGRLASITFPTGDDVAWNPTLLTFAPVTGSEYGIPAGHWKQTTHTGNGYAVTYFDAFWRPLVTERYDTGNKAATLSQTVNRYDAGGRTIFASYPTSGITSYTQSLPGTSSSYDALNRVTQVVQDSELGGLPTRTQYQTGFKTKVTDARGYSTVTSYQAFGEPDTSRPVSITMPEGVTATIVRDAFGKPLSITRSGDYGGSAVSVSRSFVYDANQLLCKRIEPETGATLFAYDGANNLAWSAPGTTLTGNSCDRGSVTSNQMVTRAYDARNRLLSIVYPDGISNTEYTYASDGAMLSATNHNGGSAVQTVYNYDKRRLLTAEALTVPGAGTFAVGYGYGANGHLGSLIYPDGRILTLVPNALGRATQAGSYATAVSYSPDGAVKQFTYGNGIVHVVTEDTRGLPEHITGLYGGEVFHDSRYDYDDNGNVAAITDGLPGNVGNIDMSYDGLDRLTAATSPMYAGSHQAGFTYDPIDNLRSAGVGNGNQYTYSYDAATNRLASMIGSQSFYFSYDVRGNLTGSNTQAHTFDMANRLRAADGLESYLYDAAGRRVRKTNGLNGSPTYYVYDKAGSLLYEWDPATMNTNDYVYLAGSLVAKATKSQSVIKGNIDGVSSGTTAVVSGWACSTGISAPISVEVYVGQTPQYGGVSIATVVADQSSEPAVAAACQASGTHYRFSIPLSSAVRSQYPNEPIIVYGLSPVGNPSSELAGSGQYTVPPNPSAPPAPASVTVPANSTGSFTVSWTVSSTATSYVLQQFNNDRPDGAWTQVYSGSATTFNASLGSGHFQYRVQACNGVGCSAFTVSNTVTVIPAAPTSISVPTSSYSASIAVSWSASGRAANYVLEESINGGGWGVAWNGNATSTTVTVSSSGTYRFQIAACGIAGCSAFTPSSNVAVTLPPTSPPSLSGPSISNTVTFTLTWSAVAGATRYQLNQNLNGAVTTPYNANGTSWSSSNLGDGTYKYQVFACNVAGCGPGGNVLAVGVSHVPVAPAVVTAPTVAMVNVVFGVQWGAVSGASRYELRQTESGARNSVGTPYSGSNTSAGITLTGIVDDNFQYAVRACNAAGCSGWTNAPNSTYLQRKGNPLAVPASGSSR